jgi:signal transduction histidine kinase
MVSFGTDQSAGSFLQRDQIMDLMLERSTEVEIRRQSAVFFRTPYLQDFLDRVAGMVVVINRYQDIIFVNKSAKDFFQAEPDKTVGLRFGEALGCWHAFGPNGGCGTTEYCKVCGAQEAIQKGIKGLDAAEECRIIREDGSALDLKVYTARLPVQDEKFVVLSVADISNEKRRRSLERIFFHDIANTVGALSGFSQLLSESNSEDKDELEQEILVLSERLVEELSAQRDLVAAENNELKVSPEDIGSGELLLEMIARYRVQEIAAGKEIVLDEKSVDVVFRNDRILLTRVIGNMIKNALEASEEGDKVSVRCEADDTEVKFHVANPKVIPYDNQLQIFQRSFSTKGTGRGLGTYSMKMISERYMKGTVSFTSVTGEGTVFTARYPRRLN